MGQGRRKPITPISFTYLATLFLLLSCSVLEDRTGCPCRLHLRITRPETTVTPEEAPLFLLLTDGSWQELRSFALPPAGVLEETVPKRNGEMSLLAAVGADVSGELSANGFEIPLGTDCPAGLLLGVAKAETGGEEAWCEIVLHRPVCRLTLRLKGGREDFPFQVRLLGDVAGISPSGGALPGKYSFLMSPFDEDGIAAAGIPRQPAGGGSLRMEILFADELLRSFALGEIMARGGYDWTAPELDSCRLHLELGATQLRLRSDPWTDQEEKRVVL